MRNAIAISGLLLLVGFLSQGMVTNTLAIDNGSTWWGGVSSIAVAAPWLFAALYVYWLPRLAMGLFNVAGASAWFAAATTSHGDLWAWRGVRAGGKLVYCRSSHDRRENS